MSDRLDPAGDAATEAAFAPAWDLGGRVLRPGPRPLVMGVVNLTDDSFYTASRRRGTPAAVAAGMRSAAILDEPSSAPWFSGK